MATRRQTQDEQFAESYGQRSSAPPSTGGISRTRNARKTARTQRNAPRQQVTYQDNVRKTRIEKGSEALQQPPERRTMPRYQRRINTRLKMKAKKLPGKSAELLTRARVSSVNVGIWSWAVPLWLAVQLPFAIFNNVIFAIASIQVAFLNGTRDFFEKGEDGVVAEGAKALVRFIWKGVEIIGDTLNDAIRAITFGTVDIQAFLELVNPTNFYYLTVMILSAYAIILILAISLIYVFARINPLFGKGATAKIITFLLCFIGYMMPLTNMFPWFMLWTAAVWRYPK